MRLEIIEISKISEDPDQPRQHTDAETLEALADSIRQHGVLQPITVSPIHPLGRYRIVTGERRWRAAQMAGLSEIPCLVREMSSETRRTEQIIENIHREDLQPLEKAIAVQEVKERLNATNREVARRLGMSESAVAHLLDLLTLPEEIGEMVTIAGSRPADGKLTEKHARFLKQLNQEPELQRAVVEKIQQEQLTGDDTGRLVKAIRQNRNRTDEILQAPSDHLSEFFAGATGGGTAAAMAKEDKNRPSASVYYAIEELGRLRVNELSPDEIAEVLDALQLLQMSVEAMLLECRSVVEAAE
ncbi:MAG: ParB/RepB/Spo0J family partition protein [Armatimonadetes bacterium]|nr:ParB/RepB/Spo0J family partition protein [Armatimonadota bacterium]